MIRRKICIGIAVGVDAVRAVALTGGHVVGTAQRQWGPAPGLALALRDVFDEVLPAIGRTDRLLVGAAVGPFAAQLVALPPDASSLDTKAIVADVREHQSRYFLGAVRPLVVAAPGTQKNGLTWVSAFDADVVDALTAVCQDRDSRLVAIATTIDALRLATTRNSLQWLDGPILVEATFSPDGELEAMRRRPVQSHGPTDHSDVVPSLAALGEDAWAFADAFSAAMVANGAGRFALVGDDIASNRSGAGARLRLALAACAVAATIAALSPGLVASRAATRLERELARLDVPRKNVGDAYRAISAATAAIAAVDSMASGRRSMSLAIAALTRALPDSAFLKDLQLDSRGGTLVAIGPHAAAIVADLAAAPEIDAAALVGAVVPQSIPGGQLERATVRFQWARLSP